MTFEGRTYATLMGSDVDRDGMYLELEDVTGGGRQAIAEWFYSDADGSLVFTAYGRRAPAAVLAWFRDEAARRLPPAHPRSNDALQLTGRSRMRFRPRRHPKAGNLPLARLGRDLAAEVQRWAASGEGKRETGER